MSPRIGPAHGAQRKPVAMPSRNDSRTGEPARPSACAFCDSQAPAATTGRVAQSAIAGNSSVMPNAASSTIAAMRPYSFAWIAQAPPTAASVATAANVTAIPISRGSPLLTNGWSARAKTNGSTGRMHGLRIVKTPPR
jgi:hypothetical protein